MKKLLLFFWLMLYGLYGFAQINNVEEKFDLPNDLNEASGSIFFDSHLVLHNDSGNENKLYELDTTSGSIARTVTVDNATNVDWEDLSQDSNSIYIGDIGNNSGDRTDLKIYKINKNDFLNDTSVTAEIIDFNYADQTDFTPNINNTEWDAETLLSIDENNLIVLTKNWVDGTTKAYPIPKTAGDYSVSPVSTPLNSGGLITGATYNPLTGKVYTIGYTQQLQSFIWVSENFTGNEVFSGTNTQIPLSSLGFEQVEAISYKGPERYFLASESFSVPPLSDEGKLIAFTTNDVPLSIAKKNKAEFKMYPNPVKNNLFISGVAFSSIEIYDAKSTLLYRGKKQNIDVSMLESGIYWVKIMFSDLSSFTKKLIKE